MPMTSAYKLLSWTRAVKELTIKTCFEFDLIPEESILRDDYLKGLYKEKLWNTIRMG